MKIANMIILIILIIVLLLSFNLFRNLFKGETTILDDVKLKESEPNNNGFALMLQKDDGTYEESNSNTWPTNMKFNNELSGCIDVNGNKIDNALSFNTSTNAVMVSTNKTAYCYLYFDKDKSLNNNVVNSSDIWDMTAEVGIDVMDVQEYRYVGTNPSNYICFGTTDKETCLNDTDKYMYRIIGVFEDSNGNKHAKLIKKEALNTAYEWNASSETDVDWNNSDLYNGIKGSYFLTNASYSYMQDTTWTDKIATWNYTMTYSKAYENHSTNSVFGPNYYHNQGKVIYLHELNRSGKSSENCYYNYLASPADADCNVGEWKTLNTKISLMYASDYALSLGSAALSYASYSHNSTMKTGWMHISNNDSGTPSSYEWTMSRYGRNIYGNYNAVYVLSDGYVSYDYVGRAIAVRPVFYLESNVEILGGTGTSDDPFMISLLTDSFE